MTYYKILVEPAGSMHDQPEPGGLGWKARETHLGFEYEDFSYLVVIENGKVYVTRELIKVLGKGFISSSDKIRLEHKRHAHELTKDDLRNWLYLNDYEPRGKREEEVKNRNQGILNFLSQLMTIKTSI